MEPIILLQCTHYSQIILHNFNDHYNSLLSIVLVACQKNTVAVIMRIHQWQIQKMFLGGQHFVKLNPLKKCTALKICKGRPGQKGRGGETHWTPPPPPSVSPCTCSAVAEDDWIRAISQNVAAHAGKSAMAMVFPPFTRVKLWWYTPPAAAKYIGNSDFSGVPINILEIVPIILKLFSYT